MKIEIKLEVPLPFVVKIDKSSYSIIHEIDGELHLGKLSFKDEKVSDVVINKRKAAEIISKRLERNYK